ncbi:hypothetical protein BJY01DRAFT_214343 [Aspergillus pseudoustus]|uniref:F-box domain-containing protein n=1 Tax=Aspergillus pseudoustus TaxID=1810923 RepID=A0ABR4JZP3_9EURO
MDPHPAEFDDSISLLSLREIYQKLNELDALEQSIATPTPARRDSDDSRSSGENKGEEDENNNKNVENDDAIQSLHRQRSALRDRAMALSRPNLRPLTMLDLPNELLRNILDHFEDPALEDGQVQWRNLRSWRQDIRGDNRKTIRNVRLVCRRLNDLASPLLCPVLWVGLNQTSLDQVVNLSRSPGVASGIRAICVGVQCFAGELASDIARFKDFRMIRVREVEDACDWHLEGIWLAGENSGGKDDEDDDDKSHTKQQSAMYNEAVGNARSISDSWAEYVDRARDNNGPVETNDEYQETLRTGYEAFCQKHREQRDLLESQSFVRTLASCMGRMPNATALGFSDEDDVFREYYHEPELLFDKGLLSRLMITPLSWYEIEKTDDMHIATARVLSELPIAIHEAGVPLHDLYAGLFPCKRDQTLVSPSPYDPTLWSKLRAACQSLRRVSFGDALNNLPIRESHLGPAESWHLNEYLRALVNSAELEQVKIYTRAFGLNDGQGREGEYNLSSVLAGVNWPCIRDISILSVGVTQAAVEQFFGGLGSGTVERFHFGSFELLDEEVGGEGGGGSWVWAFDILREKLVPQVKTVFFFACYGGEFGPRAKRENDRFWSLDFKIPETPRIVTELKRYITGADMENPLRSS